LLKSLEGQEYQVIKIKKGEKKRNAPLPFTTSSLQQEAYRKLGFSTKKTMMVAQRLYEGVDIKGEGTVGLVSYIRTDSTRLSDEAKADAKQFIIDRYGEKYYRKNNVQAKPNTKAQDAHEGIRPTSAFREPSLIKDSLDKDQYKLYELIWTRFIASQMEPAVYDVVTIDISAGEYIFKATGSSVKFPGFMLVYTEGKDEKEEEKDIILPEINEGEILKLKKLEPKQHFTEPPARYTEATLVKALEEKGIGRPSTYAPIISTILARGYVVKEKKYLKTTELGEAVTKLLTDYFKDIINVEFTANMEKELDNIADGEEKWIDVIKKFYGSFEKALEVAEEKIGKIEIPDEVSDEVCEYCGRNLVYKMGKYGKFLACPGFPECRNTKAIVESTGIKCPKCNSGQLIARKSKKGRKFYGCSNYPKCDFTTWDEPTKEVCPKCGNHLAKKQNTKQNIMKCLNENCDYEKKTDE